MSRNGLQVSSSSVNLVSTLSNSLETLNTLFNSVDESRCNILRTPVPEESWKHKLMCPSPTFNVEKFVCIHVYINIHIYQSIYNILEIKYFTLTHDHIVECIPVPTSPAKISILFCQQLSIFFAKDLRKRYPAPTAPRIAKPNPFLIQICGFNPSIHADPQLFFVDVSVQRFLRYLMEMFGNIIFFANDNQCPS